MLNLHAPQLLLKPFCFVLEVPHLRWRFTSWCFTYITSYSTLLCLFVTQPPIGMDFPIPSSFWWSGYNGIQSHSEFRKCTLQQCSVLTVGVFIGRAFTAENQNDDNKWVVARCCCCWAIAVGLGKTLTPVASSNLLDRSLLERRPNELCLDFPLTSVLGLVIFHAILYWTGCKLLKLLRVDFRLSLVVWLFKENDICNGSLILPTMMMTNPQWHVKAENVGSIPRFLSPLTTSVLTLMRKTKCCVKKYFWFEFKWSKKERVLLLTILKGSVVTL